MNSIQDVIQENVKLPTDNIKKGDTGCLQLYRPSLPLKNLIAVNPLKGFEGMPFEEALSKGASGLIWRR